MQIIRSGRLGNDTEDITFFPTPVRPDSGTVAVIDGYDVLALPSAVPPIAGPTSSVAAAPRTPTLGQSAAAQPAAAPFTKPPPKLFDVLGLKIKASPRGITHVDSKGLFVFNDPKQVATLFVTDNRGVPRAPITIQYPTGQPKPKFVEGLAYIPVNGPEFPDHLVMVTTFSSDTSPTGIEARLSIIDLNGAIAREIIPQGGVSRIFLTGVCFRSPGTPRSRASLLVSSDEDEVIHEFDFNGNVVATHNSQFSLPRQPTLHGIEGLALVPDGRVAAAGAFDGTLALLDLSSVGSAPQFIDYQIGLGLSAPSGLAWDSTTNEFLVICGDRTRPGDRFIARVAPLFDSFRVIKQVDALTQRLTYLPDEQLIAVTHANKPRGILLFTEQDQPAGTIDTSPVGISFIPTTNEFVLVFAYQPNQLSILTRKGVLSRTIDLAPAGIKKITAVTFFNPRPPLGGLFLVFDNTQDLFVVTDLTGKMLGQGFSIRDTLRVLNPSAVTAITTGPDTGAFAIANSENSELVVFRLP